MISADGQPIPEHGHLWTLMCCPLTQQRNSPSAAQQEPRSLTVQFSLMAQRPIVLVQETLIGHGATWA